MCGMRVAFIVLCGGGCLCVVVGRAVRHSDTSLSVTARGWLMGLFVLLVGCGVGVVVGCRIVSVSIFIWQTCLCQGLFWFWLCVCL